MGVDNMKKKYYVVALDKESKLLEFKDNVCYQFQNKVNSLAFIDYVLMNHDEDNLRKMLFESNRIDDINTPMFIAHLYNYRKQEKLKFYDLIFKNDYVKYLERLALLSLKNQSFYNEYDKLYLLNIFVHKYKNAQ